MAAPGAFHARGFHPTAICGIFGATAAVARLAGFDAETTTRALGIAGSMASGTLRVPRRRDADEADPPGLGGARRAHRHAARPPRRSRPALRVRRASSGSTTRSSASSRGDDRHRRAARRPRRALGDAADRVQAVPDLPLHARLARRGCRRAATGAPSRRTRSRRSSSPCPGPGCRSCSSRPSEKKTPRSEYEGKFSLQYAVASMLVRGHVGVDGLHRRRRSPTPTCSPSPRKVSHETPRLRHLPAGLPRRRPRRRSPSGETLERELPVPEGRPREPAVRRTTCARSSAPTPSSRCAADAGGRARRGDPRARAAATT